MLLRHVVRPLAIAAVASLGTVSCHDAAAPEPDRGLLWYEPDSVRMRMGTFVRLYMRTRDPNASLLYVVPWVDRCDPPSVHIDPNGVLIPLAPGVCTVRLVASVGGVSANAHAEVLVLGVRFELPALSFGARRQLAWHVYSDFSGAGDQRVRWRTSDPSIATVTDAGEIAAVGSGQVTITAVALADTTIQSAAQVDVQR